VDSARQAKEQAFLDIYRTHRTPLFRFVWRMTNSTDLAEDITQECFLVLVRGSTFDSSRGPLGTYLFGVARNLVFRKLRVSTRETEELSEVPDPIETLDAILTAERSELVQRAVANLPPLQREVIVLFEYEELSLESIAQITGTQIGAIKARLQRARESLRKQLAPLLAHKPERTRL
jgi:RNA polymerase sigma-70 factor (ECF subfamily)